MMVDLYKNLFSMFLIFDCVSIFHHNFNFNHNFEKKKYPYFLIRYLMM